MHVKRNTEHNNKELLNVVFFPRCRVKTVQDDISVETVTIWLHHTVKKVGSLSHKLYNNGDFGSYEYC